MVAPLQLQTGRKQPSCAGDPQTGFASAPQPGDSYLRTWPAGHGPPSTVGPDDRQPSATQTAAPAKSMICMSRKRLRELQKHVVFHIVTGPEAKLTPVVPGQLT